MSLTFWREETYREFTQIPLTGDVIDLGGTKNADYRELFTGWNTMVSANLSPDCDIKCDFEQPLPIKDEQYDAALLVNMLEHVYNTEGILSETYRILKPKSKVVVVVPFLIQVHPSPRDHWRFTSETLELIFARAGFEEINIKPIGAGPFVAAASLLYNALHFGILRKLTFLLATTLDSLLLHFDKNESYTKDRYPLGYIVLAHKS